MRAMLQFQWSFMILECMENSKIYCYIVILKSVQFPAILSWIIPFKSGLVVIDCMQQKVARASCNTASFHELATSWREVWTGCYVVPWVSSANPNCWPQLSCYWFDNLKNSKHYIYIYYMCVWFGRTKLDEKSWSGKNAVWPGKSAVWPAKSAISKLYVLHFV